MPFDSSSSLYPGITVRASDFLRNSCSVPWHTSEYSSSSVSLRYFVQGNCSRSSVKFVFRFGCSMARFARHAVSAFRHFTGPIVKVQSRMLLMELRPCVWCACRCEHADKMRIAAKARIAADYEWTDRASRPCTRSPARLVGYVDSWRKRIATSVLMYFDRAEEKYAV